MPLCDIGCTKLILSRVNLYIIIRERIVQGQSSPHLKDLTKSMKFSTVRVLYAPVL